MSTLEDRLRGELARKGQRANTGTAPSIDALTGVAAGRRRRNRFAGTALAAATVVGLFGAAFVVSQTGQVSNVIVSGAEVTEAADSVNGPTDGESVANAGEIADVVDSDSGEAPVEEVEESDESVAQTEPAERSDVATSEVEVDAVSSALQAASASDDVAIRASAVDFAGGSGVFVTPTSNGFGGLATRFGANGAEVIGIASPNGLDWAEVDLSGLPEAAAPVALDSFGGTYLAQLESSAGGNRTTWVATSSDLVTWQVSNPLEGDFVVAQHLLVGPGGVVLLGDDVEPDVWSGPIGGPYVLQEQLPTRSIGPANVVDGQFLVLGADSESGEEVLFSSDDGITWTSEPSDGASIPGSDAFSSGSFLGAENQLIEVGPTLGLEESGRFSVVAVDGDQAVVLVDTEDGLIWATIQR